MLKDYWKIIRMKIDWPVFLCSGGILLAFVLFSIIKLEQAGNFVDRGFDLSIHFFGAYWQFLMLATFTVGAILAVSKYGKVHLGDAKKPEMDYFNWIATICVTGRGTVGVFWDAAESTNYC